MVLSLECCCLGLDEAYLLSFSHLILKTTHFTEV